MFGIHKFQPELITLKDVSLVSATISITIVYSVSSDDFALYAIATIPYAFLIGALGLLMVTSINLRGLYKAWQVICISVFASYIWTVAFLATISFGIYFGEALRLPFFYYWVAGGIAGLIVAWRFSESGKPSEDRKTATFRFTRTTLAILVLPFACVLTTLFVVLSTMLFTGLTTGDDPEVYLIPEGYIGPVLIVYAQTTGEQARYDGNHRVYEIPANGVLVTQFDAPKGVNPDLWYVDKQGQRTQQILWGGSCIQDISDNPLVACTQGVMRKINGKDVPWHTFLIVAPLDQQHKLAQDYMERVNSILLSLTLKSSVS